MVEFLDTQFPDDGVPVVPTKMVFENRNVVFALWSYGRARRCRHARDPGSSDSGNIMIEVVASKQRLKLRMTAMPCECPRRPGGRRACVLAQADWFRRLRCFRLRRGRFGRFGDPSAQRFVAIRVCSVWRITAAAWVTRPPHRDLTQYKDFGADVHALVKIDDVLVC